MELGEKLKAARTAKGYGVEEAATLLGITRVQLWRMERKPGAISIDKLRILAKIYGVEVTTLLSDSIEFSSDKLMVQSIEMAVEAVEKIANRMTPRPNVSKITQATVKVVRTLQEQRVGSPKTPIEITEFTMLIKEILKEDRK